MARNPYIPRPSYDICAESLNQKYEKALHELRRELMAYPIGSVKHDQLDAAMRDMAAITKRLNIETAAWVKQYVPIAGRDGVATALTTLGVARTYAAAQTMASFNGLNKRMVESVMADLQTDLLAVTQNVERRVRNAVRSSTADVLRQNMSQGINGRVTNRTDIMNSLRDKLGGALDTGIIDAAGRRWKPENYVDMVVRTKLMEANTQGAVNEALERGVLYGRISRHGAADACGRWEDKIVKLVPDAPGDFPTLDEAQASREVFHPRCMHLVLPERKPPESAEQNESESAANLIDDDMFTPASSYQEATQYARDKLHIANPDFSKLSLDSANGVNKLITDIRRAFGADAIPIDTIQTTADLYKRFGMKASRATMGCAEKSTRSIGFTEKNFGRRIKPDNDPAYITSAMKRIGWFTTGDPMHTVAHELGHQMYFAAKDKLAFGEIDECLQAFHSLQKVGIIGGKNVFTETLLEYGMKNADEYAAEAFAEYMLSENPRDASKALGEWLKRIITRG